MKKTTRHKAVKQNLFITLLSLSSLAFINNYAQASTIDPVNSTYYQQHASGTITGNVAGETPQTLNSIYIDQIYSKVANKEYVYGVYTPVVGQNIQLYLNNPAESEYNIIVDYANDGTDSYVYGISTNAAGSSIQSGKANVLVKNMSGSLAAVTNNRLTSTVYGVNSGNADIISGLNKITVINQAGKTSDRISMSSYGVSSSNGLTPDNLQIDVTSLGGEIVYDGGQPVTHMASNSADGLYMGATGKAGSNNNISAKVVGTNINTNTTGAVRYSNYTTGVTGKDSGSASKPPLTYLGDNTTIVSSIVSGQIVSTADVLNGSISVGNIAQGASMIGFGENTRIIVSADGGSLDYKATVAPNQIMAYNWAYALSGAVSLKGNTYIDVTATPTKVNGEDSSTRAYILNGKRIGDYSYGAYAYINSKDDKRADGGYVADATVQLKGDIAITNDQYGGARLYADIENPNSYFRGTVLQYNDYWGPDGGLQEYNSAVLLSFDKGSTWELANNSKNAAADGGKYVITLSDVKDLQGYTPLYKNGIEVYRLNVGNDVTINLTSDGAERTFTDANNNSYRTLSSNSKVFIIPDTPGGFNITGSGNKFIVNSDVANNIADKIVIDTAVSGTNYIGVNYDVSFGNGTLETVDGKALVVKYNDTEDKFAGVNFTGKVMDEGLKKFRPKVYQGIELGDANDYDWYLTGFDSLGPSDIVDDTKNAAMFNMSMATSLIMNSDLTKRLGEIRYNPDKAGIWARIYTGENNITGVGAQSYTSVQGGIDRHIQAKRGSHFRGLALEQMSASNSYNRSGSGKSDATVLSLYDAWSGNDGKYHDLVLKTGRISNNFNTYNINGERLEGNYKNWMTGISYEYGWRKNLDNGYYYQPEAQLSYAHVNGASYMTNNGISVDQEAGNSLIGRIGVTFGKRFNKGEELFITANLLREFLGNTRVHSIYGLDSTNVGDTLRSSWCELVLGYNNRMNKKTDIYTQISKTFGGKVQRKWQVEAGFRWNW